MNITTLLARFAAKYFNLANDDKVYGIKNGDFFEVPSGGPSDDGVTKDNFVTTLLDGRTLVDSFSPIYYKKDIAFGILPHYGLPFNSTPIQYGARSSSGYSADTLGAGSFVSNVIGICGLSTGTTATGRAGFRYIADTTSVAFSTTIYEYVSAHTAFPADFCAAANLLFNSLSDGTDAYTARISFLGSPFSVSSIVPAAGDSGVALTYTHSVNSGNFVIHYRNASGTLSTINTTKAPSIDPAVTNRIVVVGKRLTATTATLTVTIDGTEYVLTTSSLDITKQYTKAGFGATLNKSAGTTARTLTISNALLGLTL